MGEQTGPRSTRVVLAEALSELRDRAARLERVEAELADTRAAIKAIERLLPAPARPAAAPQIEDARRVEVEQRDRAERIDPDEADRRVIAAFDGEQMLTGPEIQERTGLTRAQVVRVLSRLREQDRICSIGERTACRYYLGSGNGSRPALAVA